MHAAAGKTFGTAGKEQRVLKGGVEAELLRYSGAGYLNHMWSREYFKSYGLTRLRVHVDDERLASIDMQLMMGHGIGFQDAYAPWGSTSVRATTQRAKEEEGDPPFWCIIRGVENLPLKIEGVRIPENARLNLYRIENRETKPLEEFNICRTAESGLLHMTSIAGKSTNFCFLESCVRAYRSSKGALALSSGLEDYFLGTYYFIKGPVLHSGGGTYSHSSQYRVFRLSLSRS